MLVVTDLSGNSEMINLFNNFEMNEELNGSFTLSFTSYVHTNNPGHDLIMQEGLIEYDDYKFRIKQLRKQTNSIQVSCVSTYYDNSDIYRYDEYGGTRTLGEFLTYTLSGTGWTWAAVNTDKDKSMFIPNFGQSNVIKLMDVIKTTFGIEVGIGKGNQITVSDVLGPDNDSQYRYGHNIMSVTESVDTTSLKTYIEGFGKDGLHVTYTSPYAASPGIGIRHAEPIFDDEYVDEDALLEYLKSELHDYPDSVVELDDVALLDKVIGERVWLIHERMGIEYQTRVVARRVRIPSSQSTVTLGTYLPQSRSITNALATQKIEIDKNNAISRSRIEQTNEMILLEVSRLDGVDSEQRADILIQADRITQEVIDRTDANEDLSASITIQANRITSEVTARQTGDTNTYDQAVSKITQTATEIRSEVASTTTELDGRITTAESLIDQQADEILLRVTKDGVISAINLTPESVRISAAKINLQGAVSITALDSNLSGKIDDIGDLQANLTVQADRITSEVSARQTGDTNTYNNAVSKINQTATEIRSEVSTTTTALDGRLDSAESSITQQATQISLKVGKGEVISSINQTAEAIKIAASKINLAGAVTISSLDPSVSNKITKLTNTGLYTGTIEADQIIAGIINATIQLMAAKIRTAETEVSGVKTGKYIEMWNAGDVQPTIRFYGTGLHVITTNGANLLLSTGGGSPTDGSVYIRAGSRVYFDKGTVDFSGASGIIWGNNAPVAKFG